MRNPFRSYDTELKKVTTWNRGPVECKQPTKQVNKSGQKHVKSVSIACVATVSFNAGLNVIWQRGNQAIQLVLWNGSPLPVKGFFQGIQSLGTDGHAINSSFKHVPSCHACSMGFKSGDHAGQTRRAMLLFFSSF